MTRKRSFGSVRKLPSGRWQARWDDGAGNRRTAPKTFATKADATLWLSQVESDRSRSTWIDPDAGQILLRDYSIQWLESHVRIAPRTREIYAAHVHRDINPMLGGLRLAAVAPETVRRWYAELSATRSPIVAAKAYARLRQIYAQAVTDERVAKNPCRIAGGGNVRSPERRFATTGELLDIAEAIDPRYRALVLTAGLGGLRQGELFALRWNDLDLGVGSVAVRRKRLRLDSGEVIEGDTKSVAGRRTVALPDVVVEELRRHHSESGGAGSDSYVFTGPDGKPLDRSNFRKRVWLPAAARGGVPGLHFHELRHTAGTLAAHTGASTKELMARLGHASPQAALIYQHASPERDRRIASQLDRMVAAAR